VAALFGKVGELKSSKSPSRESDDRSWPELSYSITGSELAVVVVAPAQDTA